MIHKIAILQKHLKLLATDCMLQNKSYSITLPSSFQRQALQSWKNNT